MLIRYTCLLCGTALESLPESAGRVVECPDCGGESTVPHPKPIPPPVARRASPPVPAADLDDDDDPLAARREERSAKARMRTQLVLLFGGFLATAAVVAVAVLAFQNKQQRHALELAAAEKATKAEPKPAPAPKPPPPPRPRTAPTPKSAPFIPLKDITEEEEAVAIPPRPEPVQPVVGPRKKSPYFDAPLPLGVNAGDPPPGFDPVPPVAPPPKPAEPVAAEPQPPAKKDAIPPKAENAELAKLAKNLKARDPKTRLKAIEDAGKMGDGAKSLATELCDLILDANGACSTAALVALETVRPDLYKPLAKLLLDKNERVKLIGIQELTALGKRALPTVRVLLNVLRQNLNEHPQSQYALSPQVFEALKAMPADDAETLNLMRSIATPGGIKTILAGFGKKPSSSANAQRHAALDYLALWAGTTELRQRAIIPLLVSGFDNEVTVIGCVTLVGKYGRVSKDVLPTLKQLKLSSDIAVREAATKAVEAIEADLAKKE